MARRYARRPIPDEAVYQRKLAITREYFRSDMHVLEIGCGSGMTAVSHAPFVQHIHGIDGSTKMIEIARDNAQDAVSNASFEHVAAEDLAVDDENYDAVLALNVLHLLLDWREVVANIQRMLKPGGIFVSSTPCMGDSNRLLRLVLPLGAKLGVIPHVQFIAPDELILAFENAGFSIEQRWEPGEARTVFIVAKKNQDAPVRPFSFPDR